MDSSMKMKMGVAMAILVLSLALVPSVDADTADAGWYGSQLDANGFAVYDAMRAAFSGCTDDSVQIQVTFDRNPSVTLFPDAESARKDASASVGNALTAAYYDMPLAIWLWNHPASPAEVVVDTAEVVMDGETYHVAESVSFTLSVGDVYAGKVASTIAAVMDEITDRVYDGNDAEKARSISSSLMDVDVIDSPEGRECDVYDALVLEKSSAAGIAAAFMCIAESNNMDAVIVGGTTYTSDSEEGVASFWNMVVNDGKWYAVDMVMNIDSDGNVFTMVGSDTEVDGSPFIVTHRIDPDMQGSTGLSAPDMNRSAYEYPKEVSFIDEYGIYIIAGLMVLVILFVIIRSLKDGSLR